MNFRNTTHVYGFTPFKVYAFLRNGGPFLISLIFKNTHNDLPGWNNLTQLSYQTGISRGILKKLVLCYQKAGVLSIHKTGIIYTKKVNYESRFSHHKP